MNDNRMTPPERTRYWARNVAVPAGAVGYMTMAEPRFMVMAFIVFICGMLQFIYAEYPTNIRLSMPVILGLLAVAGIAALFDAVLSALITGGLLAWRCRDFRRVNNSRGLADLIRTDRGTVYAVMTLLFIVGTALMMVKYYIPTHFG